LSSESSSAQPKKAIQDVQLQQIDRSGLRDGAGFSSAIAPAFAKTVSMQSGSITSLRTGDLVRVRSGDP
jgi:hypothetical protein